MISHTFSVVSISTSSCYMAAAVIMQTATTSVVFTCHNLSLIWRDCWNSITTRWLHCLLLLASFLSRVIVTSHGWVASWNFLGGDRCSLMVEVLRCNCCLARGLIWSISILLLRWLIACHCCMRTNKLGGVEGLILRGCWLLVRMIRRRLLCWRIGNYVFSRVWYHPPWWLWRCALVLLWIITLENNCWVLIVDFIAITSTKRIGLVIPVTICTRECC